MPRDARRVAAAHGSDGCCRNVDSRSADSRHEGRKQYTGELRGLEGELVLIRTKNDESHALPYSEISSAKLLLTDKLINATAPLSTEGADSIQTIEE